MIRPQISEVLRSHKQFPTATCSVSALEFVAKLYGLLPLDSFPLQENPLNAEKGFDEPDLQGALGLRGWADYYSIESALALIEEETNQDRSLAISLATFREDDSQGGYHIYVVASTAGQSALIDPADGQVLTTTREDLAKALALNSEQDQHRKELHILALRPMDKGAF